MNFRRKVEAQYLVEAGPVIDIFTGKERKDGGKPQKSKPAKLAKPKEIWDDHDAESFLKSWYEEGSFSDFNLAMDRGYIEYAAWLLAGAGVFEDENEDSNASILYFLKDYTDAKARKDGKDLLKNTEVWVDSHNQHAFIPQVDVDYFMSKEDMERDGYKFDTGYDKNGKEYKQSRL